MLNEKKIYARLMLPVVAGVVGKFAVAGCQSLVIWIAAKNETAAFVGVLGLIQGAFALIFTGLVGGVFFQVIAGGTKDSTDSYLAYIWTAFPIGLVLGLLFVGFYVGLDWLLLAMLVAAAKIMEFAGDVTNAVYRRRELVLPAMASQLFRALALCVLILFGYFVGVRYEFILFGYVFVMLLAYFYDRSRIGVGKCSYFSIWKSVAGYVRFLIAGRNLALTALVTSMSTVLGRYMVHGFLDDEQAGVFYVCTIVVTVFTTFGAAISQQLHIQFGGEDGGLVLDKAILYFGYYQIIPFSCLLWGDQALTYVFAPQYGAGAMSLVLMLEAVFFFVLRDFVSLKMVSLGKTRPYLYSTFWSLFILVVGMFLLLPKFGLNGAGLAMLIASAVGCLYLVRSARRVI